MTTPLTLTEAARMLRAAEISSLELTHACLAQADRLDEQLGAYLARFDETALAQAATADAELGVGIDRGPLHGIPVAVKDIVAQSDGPTTAQSLVLDLGWAAGKDAPVVARLKAAGAVITGKVTTMEFAVGLPDPTKPFPVPRNPWDPATWPGGSSSGTANGIAAGMFLAGIGTDTGGSIRIPAAFCGTTGLMPTFGRVPKSGCVPLGYSLDHVGPLARSAADCAAVLAVIGGHDASDPDSVDRPMPDFASVVRSLAQPDPSKLLAGVRIGVERAHHSFDGADAAAPRCFEGALDVLRSLGATVVDVVIPHFSEVTSATLLTMSCEAMAYHRGDLAARWDDYSPTTRHYVVQGALCSGADFVQAQRVRRVGQAALARVFRDVDLIVTPTAGIGAPHFDDLAGEALDEFGKQIHTTYWDGVGNPVIAAPMGFTDAGLPLSLQLASRPFDEMSLVRAADAFQSQTDWHLRVAPMVAASMEALA